MYAQQAVDDIRALTNFDALAEMLEVVGARIPLLFIADCTHEDIVYCREAIACTDLSALRHVQISAQIPPPISLLHGMIHKADSQKFTFGTNLFGGCFGSLRESGDLQLPQMPDRSTQPVEVLDCLRREV